jgi:hypothetical protein|uniref:Uncharacterized protein ycf33 n=1 Tax=Vaucheria litorea TaxID=109269 RepID=B7T1T9_VAULI|nr:hypothetical protein RF33 [Vaucheria litorea]ACF70905.1 hypothetical protein RF33 [Vaucheria litorea]
MNFWQNLLRYFRFFFSSLLGLFLVILLSIKKLLEPIKDKRFIFLFLCISLIIILIILNLMLNIDYY